MSLDQDLILGFNFPSRMVKDKEGKQQVGKKPLVIKGNYLIEDGY